MWISAPIGTDSHRLSEAAFRVLMLDQSNMRVHNVQDNRFVLSVKAVDEDVSEAMAAIQGHHAMRAFLIALNVAAVGHFYWAEGPNVHPIVYASDELGTPLHASTLVVQPERLDEPLDDLREQDVANAALIFAVLGKEQDLALEAEYSRGLLLLEMRFGELNFRREAFGCFYRALENFVARRILKVTKLKNELRDLQRGIEMVSGSGTFAHEIKLVYAARSSQVAHAQIEPREVTLEEVLKTKTLLDLVMSKTFRAHGVQMMDSLPPSAGDQV